MDNSIKFEELVSTELTRRGRAFSIEEASGCYVIQHEQGTNTICLDNLRKELLLNGDVTRIQRFFDSIEASWKINDLPLDASKLFWSLEPNDYFEKPFIFDTLSGQVDLPDLPLTTPSLLFPAISLLMLAYTNRFLGLATVVRGLHANWRTTQESHLLPQIRNLRKRIQIIKNMQTLGVLSLMMCVVSMTLLFFDRQTGGQVTFGLSLLLMLGSLTLSLVEIQMSGKALDLQLKDVKCREE